MIDWPNTPQMLATVGGVALFGALVTQWLKQYIAAALVVNAVCLVACLVASTAAWFVLSQNALELVGLYTSLLTGFIGASLATFGYEVINNLAAFLKPKE